MQTSLSDLRAVDSPESIPRLIRYLTEGSEKEKCVVTYPLARLADTHFDEVAEAIPSLLRMAEDPKHHVRHHALKLILRIAAALSEEQREFIAGLGDRENRDSNKTLIAQILAPPATVTQTQPIRQSEATPIDSLESRELRIGIGHLFTTGHDLKTDRIFHIGGVRFTENSAPEFRDWIVNPGRPITFRLKEKSRLSNPVVRTFESWEDQASEIRAFFQGLDVLFLFNLHGERDWFKRYVISRGNSGPVLIDLHEMASFFLPDRTFYDPGELIRRAVPATNQNGPKLPLLLRGLARLVEEVIVSIRGQSNDSASRSLVLEILGHALVNSGPVEFQWMYRIATNGNLRFTDELPRENWEFSLPESPPAVTQVRDWIRSFLPPPPPVDAGNGQQAVDLHPISPNSVDHGIQHLTSLNELEVRPQQMKYARFICDAINRHGTFVIESGTGTGKTFGYLVPAAEFLLKHPTRKVIIATSTKNLQAQLLERELGSVTVRRSKYQDLRGAILKGKSNYLCLRALLKKYHDLYINIKRSSGGALDRIAWLHYTILCVRALGDLEARIYSPRLERGMSELYDEVNAGQHCILQSCSLDRDCIYDRVRQLALESHFVITNHHKLPSIGTEIWDSAAICLIDEADQFPDNLRDAIATELTSKELIFKFASHVATSPGTKRGFIEIIRDTIKESSSTHRSTLSDRVLSQCNDIIGYCERLFAISGVISVIASLSRGHEVRWQNLKPNTAASDLIDNLNDISRLCGRIADGLDTLNKIGPDVDILKDRREQLVRYRKLAVDIKIKAEKLVAGYDTEAFVHIVESGWTLRSVSMKLGPIIEELFLNKVATTIFTSATLFVENSLSLFHNELGLDRSFDDRERLDSPFDYGSRVRGYVASALPEYDWLADPEVQKDWRVAISQAIVQLVAPVYGRTLVLLTNSKELAAIVALAKPLLDKADVEVLVQRGTSLLEISTFRSIERSVLFGVDRFWTGVDFPGPTLSQVIIVRSPNPSLSNPLVEHRKDFAGWQFWDRYYSPIARLRMRQGFGRLMRKAKDRGVFVLLDSRVANGTASTDFESELPIQLDRAADIGSGISPMTETVREILAHLRLTR